MSDGIYRQEFAKLKASLVLDKNCSQLTGLLEQLEYAEPATRRWCYETPK